MPVAPSWSQITEEPDPGTFEFYATVGSVSPADDREVINVALGQRDEGPPAVSVYGIRLTAAEALVLAELVASAAQRISA